jgi:hypothetical protein
MGISNTTFVDKSDPLSKLNKTLEMINKVQVEASFMDERGKPLLTRDYIEMVLSEYAQSQQNPQMFNKWLQLDTKLDKALREYKSDIQMLLSSMTQMGQAQQMVAEPVNMPGPTNAPAPTPQVPQGQSVDKTLPTM